MPNIDTVIAAKKESLKPKINAILPSRGVPGDKSSLTSWTEIAIYPQGATKNGRVIGGNGTSGGSWVLPLPQDLSEPHSLQYEPIEFGAIARLGAGALKSALGNGPITDPNKAEEALSGFDFSGILKGAAYAIGEEILGMFGNQQMVNFLRGSLRNTANPNIENMFKTANLRTFQFSWNLTPISESDAAKIKEFITKMRMEIYPENQEYGGGWNRLKFPSEFIISFYSVGLTSGKPNTIMKTAPCVCTDFVVQYTPNGAFNTHTDGQPTTVSISGTFQEMYSLHKGDISSLEK